MDSIIKFAKSSGIFFIGTILSKAIIFLLLPIYTKYISPGDYGFYDLSITYSTVATSILFCDIWSSVMRFMYDSKDYKYKYKSILSGWVIFGISMLFYLVCSIFIYKFLNIKYFWLIVVYGISLNFQNMYSSIIRGFNKNIVFAISGIINTLFNAATNIFLIVVIKYGFASMYIASILGNIIQIVFLEMNLKLICNLKFNMIDIKLLKKMFKYTLPLSLNSVSYWILTSYNRIIISKVLSINDNGVYAIANKFSSVISLVTTCFVLAWQEMSFSRDNNSNQNGKFYTKACNMYMKFLGLGIIIILPIFYVIFPILVNNQYLDSKNIIPLFLISAIISAYCTFIGNIFYAIKYTKIIFISSVISCILNIIIAYPLIKLLSLNGANLSIIISFLVNIGIRTVLLKRNIGFKINIKLFLLLGILVTIFSLIYIYCNLLVNILGLIIALLIGAYIFRNVIVMFFKVIKNYM